MGAVAPTIKKKIKSFRSNSYLLMFDIPVLIWLFLTCW